MIITRKSSLLFQAFIRSPCRLNIAEFTPEGRVNRQNTLPNIPNNSHPNSHSHSSRTKKRNKKKKKKKTRNETARNRFFTWYHIHFSGTAITYGAKRWQGVHLRSNGRTSAIWQIAPTPSSPFFFYVPTGI